MPNEIIWIVSKLVTPCNEPNKGSNTIGEINIGFKNSLKENFPFKLNKYRVTIPRIVHRNIITIVRTGEIPPNACFILKGNPVVVLRIRMTHVNIKASMMNLLKERYLKSSINITIPYKLIKKRSAYVMIGDISSSSLLRLSFSALLLIENTNFMWCSNKLIWRLYIGITFIYFT
jgi:hypothetical protein